MSIRKAALSDVDLVVKITHLTISEIYPQYYPKGAVDFFLNHHSQNNIFRDIENNAVYLCKNAEQTIVGTVTIKENEICRLFVLPKYQGNGYGRELIKFSENLIAKSYSEIRLDASLPAKGIYIRKGYKEVDYNAICTENGDFLCYDVMVKDI